MRILNLYAGVGGNRALWPEGHEIVAVELNPQLAAIYAARFIRDTVIITDAHAYLLEHYKEFDFIWSSPPCPSHSKARFLASSNGDYPPVYPDMALWQEIIFLKHFFKGKWVIENVHPYYGDLIPCQQISKHSLWANFNITPMKLSNKYHFNTVDELQQEKGFSLPEFCPNKVQVLRNMVKPELGLHIFECAMKEKQATLEVAN